MDDWIVRRDKCRYIVATGMHGIVEARRRLGFKQILEAASLFVPDGFSLVAIARMRGFHVNGRVSGPDLMLESCRHAELIGHKMFFYGDTEETLQALSDRLKQNFPDLQIAGYLSPPFRPLTTDEDDHDVEIINTSSTDILWIGLGLPKQEIWMNQHAHRLNVPVVVGVGAAFKFLSGRSKRAPSWIGENGFEWLWRLIFEPTRVWRRVLLDGPVFVGCVLKETIDSKWFRNKK